MRIDRLLPITLVLGLGLLGGASCAPSGGGGRSSGGSTSTPSTPTPTTSPAQAHWLVALAALGPGGAAPHTPLAIDQVALDRWNELIAQGWPAVRGMIDARLELELRKALAGLAAPGSTVTVQNVRNVVIDTAGPPALRGGGAGTPLTLGIDMPASGTWRIALTADVVVALNLAIGGFPILNSIALDITADVADLRISGAMTIDASRPERPLLVGAAGAPQVSFRLVLSSQNPLLSVVLNPLTSVLDPVIALALAAGGVYVQQQAGALVGGALPATTWGRPAPARPLPPGTLPLGPLADSISAEIQSVHLPFDTLLPAAFDQPGFGNGQVVAYYDHGDSADWTGHYLAAECFRYDLTGDAKALAGAERVARGLLGCLEVAGGDLLSRCVVPASSPRIADIQGANDFFLGTVGGVPTGSIGDVSRDSYVGSFFGMVQAWQRVPSLRPQARDFISRNLAYLEGGIL